MQCVDGKINTDGSDLLDIRFGEGEECVDYFEQCCAVDQVTNVPQLPPNIPPPISGGGTGNPNMVCGLRNPEGIGFRITGNADGESEYGE